MKEKLTNFFKRKSVLIVVAVICAIVAWLFVLNFTNPMAERTIEVPISLNNTSNLSQRELLNTTQNMPTTANVTVTGRKTLLDNLTALDFKCAFDLSAVEKSGEKVLKLDKPKCQKIGITIKKYTPESAAFTFDKIGVATLGVVIDYSDDLLKEGFKFISVLPETESIQVTGLESEISELDCIRINLNGILEKNTIDSSKSASYIGKFMRKNGEDVTSKFDSVSVIVKMEVGKEIPLVYSVEGDPAYEHYVNSHSITNDRVVVQGPPEELKKLHSVNLGKIDVSGKSSSFNREIDVEDYLPDGVTVYGSSRLTMSVEILEYDEEKYEFSLSEISLVGKNDSYNYSFDMNSVEITVRGIREKLDSFKKSSLEPTLNFESKAPGSYIIPLELFCEVPGIEVVGDYTVKVTISQRLPREEK